MSLSARSFVSTTVNSFETGLEIGRKIRDIKEPPAVIIAYATICHDQAAFLRGLREAVESQPLIIGCTTQGVLGPGTLLETSYGAGAIGIGGEGVTAAASMVHEIQIDPFAKGRTLGEELMKQITSPPKAVVIHYDPLCGADIGALLEGFGSVVRCPVIGGAAGQTMGPMVATYQFLGDNVRNKSAVAVGLAGDFSVVIGASHGTNPIGVEMTVTKSEGTKILELDGRRATDVWAEISGAANVESEHLANLAIGLPREDSDEDGHRVLAPFGVDLERGAVILQASLPVGSVIMLHHRTEEGVLGGARKMTELLKSRLGTRKLRVALGFECGARTAAFLGDALALKENVEMQQSLGPDAAWLGMLAWGEVFPLRDGPKVFNFTYPVLCLAE